MSTAAAVTGRIDDLPGLVGTTLGTTRWVSIDQERVDAFADVGGDHQWIHVDPERAASGPYGTTIAHGLLTLSLCIPFIDQLLEVSDRSMAINYGVDRVRFPAPVPVGSHIRGVGEIISATEFDGGIQLVMKITVELRGQEKPCCVAEMVLRFYR